MRSADKYGIEVKHLGNKTQSRYRINSIYGCLIVDSFRRRQGIYPLLLTEKIG
jgi:hypothetical protein